MGRSMTEIWYGIEFWTSLIRASGEKFTGWWSSGTRFDTPEEARERMTELDPDLRPRILKFTLTRELVD
jgi:hypothetical protein